MLYRLLAAVCLAFTAAAQTMSVEKLITFVESSQKFIQEKKMTDNQLAGYLAKVKLTDRLDDRTIEEMQSAGPIGPKTMAALKALRDRSQSLTAANITPPPKYVPPPPPSAEEQAAIITEVREYALNYSKSLPNFLCTEVTRRKAAPPVGSRYAGGAAEPSYQTMDTLTIRLSYYEQKEDYKLILINNNVTTQDYKSLGGATTTGDFGSMMKEIFEPSTEARFEWDHWGTLRGRLTLVFAYRVEQSRSHWHINWDRKLDIMPAYRGKIYVDKDTKMVTRVTLEGTDIPADFPIRAAETTLDYDFQDISGHTFLLPLKATTIMSSAEYLTKNDEEFRVYRKYSAESDIKFDVGDVPAPLSDDKTKETAPPPKN